MKNATLALVATLALFLSPTVAEAHCGSCGSGDADHADKHDDDHDHADKQADAVKACKAKCDGDDKAACEKKCDDDAKAAGDKPST